MFFNGKYHKFFAPEDSPGKGKVDDVDFTKMADTKDIDSQLDKIDDSGELDNILTGKEPSEPPSTEDKGKVDDNLSPDDLLKEPAAKTETEEPKVETTPSDPPKPETKVEDKEDTEDKVLVTEDFISNIQFSEDKEKDELLRKNFTDEFLGKPLEEIGKSYAHARSLIGKKREELVKDVELPQTDLKVPLKPEAKEDIEKTREDLIYNSLRADYPELPKDPEERNKWLADLNYSDPRTAKRYLDKETQANNEIDQIWQFTDKLSKEYPTRNSKAIQGEITAIKDYFEENIGVDPKQLGYDFTLDKEGNNPIIDGLIAATDNPENFDPDIVKRFQSIPLIQRGKIMEKFFKQELGNIFKAVRTQSRAEAAETLTNKKPAPSLVGEPNTGKTKNDDTTVDQIKQITDIDQIDNLLDQEDNKHWSG